MAWLSLALIALNISLGTTLLFSGNQKLWHRMRIVAVLAFELGAIVTATLILVTLAYLASAPSMASSRLTDINLAGLEHAAGNTSLLVVTSTLWGTMTGLGGAFFFTASRRRSGWIGSLAALLWVLPTFVLAVAVQEVQAQIFNLTGLRLSGGYAVVSPGQVFWAAVVLGIRPAAYVFRQSRVVLAEIGAEEWVRTASAKGLPWRFVTIRHILRPSLPLLAISWLISFRFMVGSLPLVEYFFAYPGLGNLFLASVGLRGPFNADQAIAAVAILAGAFLVLDAAVNVFQQLLDPRLRETRLAAEVAS